MTKRTIIVLSLFYGWMAMDASANALQSIDFTGTFSRVHGPSDVCPTRLEVTSSDQGHRVSLAGLMVFEDLNGAWVIHDSGDSDFRIREKLLSKVVNRSLIQERELWQFPRPGRLGSTIYEQRSWTLLEDSIKAVFEIHGRKGETEFGFFCEYEKQ